MLTPTADRFVRAERVGRHAIGPKRGAIIDEGANGNLRCEVRNAAHVVVMEVRDQEVIDAIDARRAGGCEDPIGIAAADGRAAPTAARTIARINQERLALRSYDEGRLSPLDIDEEDFEVPGMGRTRQQQEQDNDEGDTLHEPMRFA